MNKLMYLVGFLLLLPSLSHANPVAVGYDAIYLNSLYRIAATNLTPPTEDIDCFVSIWDNETDPEIPVYNQIEKAYDLVNQERTCRLLENQDQVMCYIEIDPEYIRYYPQDPREYSVHLDCANGINVSKHVVSEVGKPLEMPAMNAMYWFRENRREIIIFVLTMLFLVFCAYMVGGFL